MTNTQVFEPGKPENPLFTKLRRRFSYDGDRTVAEYMMEQVLKSEGTLREKCHTAEYQYLKANNLPRSYKKSTLREHSAKKNTSFPLSFFLIALSVIMLIAVIFSLASNFRLNKHIEQLEAQLSSAEAEFPSFMIGDDEDGVAMAMLPVAPEHELSL